MYRPPVILPLKVNSGLNPLELWDAARNLLTLEESDVLIRHAAENAPVNMHVLHAHGDAFEETLKEVIKAELVQERKVEGLSAPLYIASAMNAKDAVFSSLAMMIFSLLGLTHARALNPLYPAEWVCNGEQPKYRGYVDAATHLRDEWLDSDLVQVLDEMKNDNLVTRLSVPFRPSYAGNASKGWQRRRETIFSNTGISSRHNGDNGEGRQVLFGVVNLGEASFEYPSLKATRSAIFQERVEDLAFAHMSEAGAHYLA